MICQFLSSRHDVDTAGGRQIHVSACVRPLSSARMQDWHVRSACKLQHAAHCDHCFICMRHARCACMYGEACCMACWVHPMQIMVMLHMHGHGPCTQTSASLCPLPHAAPCSVLTKQSWGVVKGAAATRVPAGGRRQGSLSSQEVE